MKEVYRKFLANFSYKIQKYYLAYRSENLIKAGRLILGKGTYGSPIIDEYKGSEAKVTIGNYTSIGPNVRIITGGMHPTKSISQYPIRSRLNLPGKYTDGNPYSNGDITIGSDVWIGTGVTILSGVRIGNGAIIGSCSLVTKDIPDFAIAMGSPAKYKKFRFTPNQISALNNIGWWNWEIEKICEEVEDLTRGNIENFILKHNKL
jgi:acetyltransferase-like isoleucine patch superfamily enzyme